MDEDMWGREASLAAIGGREASLAAIAKGRVREAMVALLGEAMVALLREALGALRLALGARVRGGGWLGGRRGRRL